jgi:exopolyphosphatase/guanosine-5'-triphosphate,3'-diphosphate pyrophosphatase
MTRHAATSASDASSRPRERLAVKIGKGGITKGIITEDGFRRALVAIQSFKNRIDAEKVDQTIAFGTSALRNATNKHHIIGRIKLLTGIDVEVISGDREAEFIYYGVKSALDIGTDKALIIDIGGGSVEFIIADSQEIYWKKSFEIGAQRLLEDFQKNDPITTSEITQLDNYFQDNLTELFGKLQSQKPSVLVGSSGTFDTLSDIFCQQHDIKKSIEDTETPLTIPGFNEIYTELIAKNRMQRLQIPGMIEMRVDMIVVACCLIRFILNRHRFDWIRVSTYALKEGVLALAGEREKA